MLRRRHFGNAGDLAAELGIRKLSIKQEFANPTGSHKDRMSAFVARRASLNGASTIVAASSGNAGVSLAAYATAFGLECVVVTTHDMSPNWQRVARFHGAGLIATQTVEERWDLVAQKVRSGEWYPATNYISPPVGSNPFGVDGLRAIAFELHLQTQDAPLTDIVVPTSRGDLLWAIARGFQDMKASGLIETPPKVHAFEPHPRISSVLAGEDCRDLFSGDSKLVSIGGTTVTKQSLSTLSMCGGSATEAAEAVALADQKTLARHGYYLELSSAGTLTGLRNLLTSGAIKPKAHVALVATSHGYKEIAEHTAPIPIVRATEPGSSVKS